MSGTEKTKTAILDFMLEAWSREGDAFDATKFYLRKMKYLSRPELDSLETAIGELVEDGYFEKRQGHYHLTGAGHARLYEG